MNVTHTKHIPHDFNFFTWILREATISKAKEKAEETLKQAIRMRKEKQM